MPARKTPTRKDAVQTRAALLRAAGDAFARDGFRRANLRRICGDAGVNLGAVSHYFGSKQDLYNEVIVVAHRTLIEREPPPPHDLDADSAAQLGQWVHYVLRFTLIRRASHPHAGPLFAREVSDPTPGLDALIGKVLLPLRRRLRDVIAGLLGPSASAPLQEQCTSFVLGLCVFPELAAAVLQRVGQPVPRTEAEIRVLADQVTVFALGGIRELAAHAKARAVSDRG